MPPSMMEFVARLLFSRGSVRIVADHGSMSTATRHAARMRLARWDPDTSARFQHAGIDAFDAPSTAIVNGPIDITLELDAYGERDARLRIAQALYGAMIVQPQDFIIVAAC